MIQVIFGILLLFVFPFSNKFCANLIIFCLFLFSAITFFILDNFESFIHFFLINMAILLIGYLIRSVVSKSKNDRDLEDLEAMYKDKKTT